MISAEHAPGFEVQIGTLGTGLSTFSGLAWGRDRRGETGRTWVFMLDGDVQVGQIREAVQAARFHGIDNLLGDLQSGRDHGRERPARDRAMSSVMEVGDTRRGHRIPHRPVDDVHSLAKAEGM